MFCSINVELIFFLPDELNCPATHEVQNEAPAAKQINSFIENSKEAGILLVCLEPAHIIS
jgi:hypothetical protein